MFCTWTPGKDTRDVNVMLAEQTKATAQVNNEAGSGEACGGRIIREIDQRETDPWRRGLNTTVLWMNVVDSVLNEIEWRLGKGD